MVTGICYAVAARRCCGSSLYAVVTVVQNKQDHCLTMLKVWWLYLCTKLRHLFALQAAGTADDPYAFMPKPDENNQVGQP